MDDEINAHIALEIHERMSQGESRESAHRAALRDVQSIALVKENTRDVWAWRWAGQFFQDLRYAARGLAKHLGFATVVVITMALGIGANAAIFSAIYAVLLRPLPYSKPNELYAVELVIPRPQAQNLSLPARIQDFLEWRKADTSFSSLAALTPSQWNLTGSDEPERIFGARVSANFFELLGIEMARGRTFSKEEEQPGKDDVAVISYDLWKRHYGSDPTVVGKSISLDGRRFLVVGIAPAPLVVPTASQLHPAMLFGQRIDVWTPWAPTSGELQGENHNCAVLARLKPGEDLKRGRQQLDGLMNAWMRAVNPQLPGDWKTRFIPIREVYAGDVRFRILLVMAASGLLLLIACTNIANLFLAKSAARSAEFATRIALGASRSRIVRQMLSESVLPSITGGLVGLAAAYWLCHILAVYSPADVPLLREARINIPVLLFATMLSIVVGIACGFVPAWQADRGDISRGLKTEARALTGSESGNNFRMSLVGIQIALGTVLLILTGLLLNSFIKVMNADRGYDVERVLALDLAPYGNQYASPAQRINFYRELLNQIRSIPGVQAAGAISALPIAESAGSNRIDYATDSRQDELSGALLGRPIAGVRVATPGYFATAGIVLRAGRFFTETDRAPVAVVSDRLAKSLWRGEPPDAVIGRQIRQGDVQGPLITIIGVVSDARSGSLERELLPQLYRPHHQRAFGMMTVVIRTAQQPEAISSLLRAEVRKMDGNIPIPVLRTLREILDASVAQRRFQLGLISLFGLASLMLGIVGIYAAVAYSVSCRTRDIGLRIALGAVPMDVMQWILLNGMKPVLIGLSAGLFCAVAIGRVIRGVLFEVAPTDLTVLSSVAALLLVTSALACYVPARRAARLDPVAALRIQ